MLWGLCPGFTSGFVYFVVLILEGHFALIEFAICRNHSRSDARATTQDAVAKKDAALHFRAIEADRSLDVCRVTNNTIGTNVSLAPDYGVGTHTDVLTYYHRSLDRNERVDF